MSETYYCWYPLQIRFRDLDPLAHVNNSVYFIYFEEARSHYFDQLAPWLKQWPAGKEHQQPDETEVIVLDKVESETPNPRIRTDQRGRHYGILVKEATCTYELPLIRSDKVEVGVRVTKVGHSSIHMEQFLLVMIIHVSLQEGVQCWFGVIFTQAVLIQCRNHCAMPSNKWSNALFKVLFTC